MQVFRTLAGYSLGRADIVRRAMAKKKHKVMQQERQFFIHGETDENGNVICEGAVRRGVSEKVAEKIFEDMSAFSSYAFNKSHAAAYSFVAYRTAYLKCHYPAEYFSALMTGMMDSASKVFLYTEECKRMNIKILPPSVNKSFAGFVPEGKDIRFGLLAVKNLGRGIIDRLVAEREKGEYTSMFDFCSRNISREFNRRALEGLIKAGALDGLEDNRRQMLYGIDAVMTAAESESRYASYGQMDMFGEIGVKSEFNLEKTEEMPRSTLLAMEKEATGLYMSGHPMDEYVGFINRLGAVRNADILALKVPDGKRVTVAGMVSGLKIRQLKNGNQMGNAILEDMSGSIGLTVFANAISAYRNLLTSGQPLTIIGKVSQSDDKDPELICERVEAIPETAKGVAPVKTQKKGLYLRVKNTECEEFSRIKEMLSLYHGNTPVYIYCTETKKTLKAPEDLMVKAQDGIEDVFEKIIGKENVKLII